MTVCAWCGAILTPGDPSFVTHGICPKCQVAFVGGPGPASLKEFIGRFNFPIMVVNADVELTGANAQALELVGRTAAAAEGHRGGELLECIHSVHQGGCGRSVHCKACTIRNSVRETYETGAPMIDVESYQQVMTDDGLKKVQFRISTAKVSDSVLLKIVAV